MREACRKEGKKEGKDIILLLVFMLLYIQCCAKYPAHLVSLHPHNNPEMGIIIIILLFFINGKLRMKGLCNLTKVPTQCGEGGLEPSSDAVSLSHEPFS